MAEPRESTVQKWLYWVVAPAVAIVCISLVFKSVLAGLGLGAFVLPFLAMMYLRYKLWCRRAVTGKAAPSDANSPSSAYFSVSKVRVLRLRPHDSSSPG